MGIRPLPAEVHASLGLVVRAPRVMVEGLTNTMPRATTRGDGRRSRARIAAAAAFPGGFVLLIGLTIAGTGCGIVSAAVAYRSDDRRFVVIQPALAHVALLMIFFGTNYQGQG